MTVGTEESQRRISALVRVGRAMVSAADYEQALGTLIETVSRLLDVETGGFPGYDPARAGPPLLTPGLGGEDPHLVPENPPSPPAAWELSPWFFPPTGQRSYHAD